MLFDMRNNEQRSQREKNSEKSAGCVYKDIGKGRGSSFAEIL